MESFLINPWESPNDDPLQLADPGALQGQRAQRQGLQTRGHRHFVVAVVLHLGTDVHGS